MECAGPLIQYDHWPFQNKSAEREAEWGGTWCQAVVDWGLVLFLTQDLGLPQVLMSTGEFSSDPGVHSGWSPGAAERWTWRRLKALSAKASQKAHGAEWRQPDSDQRHLGQRSTSLHLSTPPHAILLLTHHSVCTEQLNLPTYTFPRQTSTN